MNRLEIINSNTRILEDLDVKLYVTWKWANTAIENNMGIDMNALADTKNLERIYTETIKAIYVSIKEYNRVAILAGLEPNRDIDLEEIIFWSEHYLDAYNDTQNWIWEQVFSKVYRIDIKKNSQLAKSEE